MMATWIAMIPTAWRLALVSHEARLCSVRFLHGTKRLVTLSTRICRVGRSDARRRGPVPAIMDRAVDEAAEDARASVVNASHFAVVCRFARQSRCVIAIFLSIKHELPDCV